MICKKCGIQLDSGAYFCPECGSLTEQETVVQPPISETTEPSFGTAPPIQSTDAPFQTQEQYADEQSGGIFCSQCGKAVSSNELFCSDCGAKIERKPNQQEQYTQPTTQNNKGLIAIIAVLLVLLILFIIFGIYALLTVFSGTDLSQDNSSGNVTPIATTQPISTPLPPVPEFPHISASSTRGVDYTSGAAIYYPVTNIIDGDYSTCWSPNRNIELTPTVTLTADTPQHVTGIRLSNGYFKSVEAYTRNRRITKALVSYEGGEQVVNMSIDSYGIMTDVLFTAPVDTSYIKIKVLESYYGDWKDICISEIEVY